jgi:hypothetical protein
MLRPSGQREHPSQKERKVFSKNCLFVPAGFVFVSFLGVSAAKADSPQCYTLASLQGTYAVINTYGANVALGLQTEYLDGNGNLTRTGILNQPTVDSTTGARTVGTVTSTGTYTVNCDGTGTIVRIVTKPDGSKASATDDFIITGAITVHVTLPQAQGWQLIATTIVDAQEAPSVIIPGGIFVTRVHARLPSPPTATQQ